MSDTTIRSEAEIGPEAIRAIGDHLAEFIGMSAKVFFRRPIPCGEIPLVVGPDFTLGDLVNFGASLLGRHPLGRNGWEARVHAVGEEDSPVVCFFPPFRVQEGRWQKDLEEVRRRVRAHLARKRLGEKVVMPA